MASNNEPEAPHEPQACDLAGKSPWSVADYLAIRIPKGLYGLVIEFQKAAEATLVALLELEALYQERLTYSWSVIVQFVFASEDRLETCGGVFSRDLWNKYIEMFQARRCQMYMELILVTKERLQELDFCWNMKVDGGGLLPMAILDFSQWLARKAMFVEEMERRLDKLQIPDLRQVIAQRELLGWPCKNCDGDTL
ncbi:MAG: hypothetical protein M1835_001284 [Candelina submexicana]|nr:MAG: hypothetical protein M1835_001284 [Candelina submexicana]